MKYSLGARVILAALMCGALGVRVNIQQRMSAEINEMLAESEETTYKGQPPQRQNNKWCKAGGDPAPSPPPGAVIGWKPTSTTYGNGKWCQVGKPEDSWNLNNFCQAGSGVQLKVLTYNLYWWNLFLRRKGWNGRAGKNIAAFAKDVPFDLMGFQECADAAWPLKDAADAGMKDAMTIYQYQHDLAIAYRTSEFVELERGGGQVAEDGRAQYYGTRIAMWIRLRHTSGKTIFFMNHHGPTPVNSGGACGAEATAFNILKMIAEKAKVGDHVVLVGDFNAWSNGPDGAWLAEIGNLACHLDHIYSHPVVEDGWGIDNIFASCARTVSTTRMPKGGSDHPAVNAIIEI